MNRSRLLFSIIFFSIFSTFAKDILDYKISLDYIFDSNISRNLSNYVDHYILPELDIKLNSPQKVPLYLKGILAYDHYIRARDYDDNSPFLTLGIGYNGGSKKLKLRSEILGEYYMAFGYEKGLVNEAWKAVIRTAKWNNKLSYKKKRKLLSLEVEGGIQEYSKEDSNVRNNRTAYLLEIIPSFYYKFKKNKKAKVGLKRFGLEFKYELQDAYSGRYDFSRFSIPVNLRVKLFRVGIDSEIELTKKIYQNPREHDFENSMITPYYNRISLGSEISVPLISNFEIVVGGKLRYRDSNWNDFNYNRHTAHIELKWQHKVKR